MGQQQGRGIGVARGGNKKVEWVGNVKNDGVTKSKSERAEQQQRFIRAKCKQGIDVTAQLIRQCSDDITVESREVFTPWQS